MTRKKWRNLRGKMKGINFFVALITKFSLSKKLTFFFSIFNGRSAQKGKLLARSYFWYANFFVINLFFSFVPFFCSSLHLPVFHLEEKLSLLTFVYSF